MPTHAPERVSWKGMMERCYNSNHHSFHNYGGRGITVCVRWFNFDQFLEDIGSKPSPELTLERIDNDGNYEPGNVIWATASEQRCNQRIPTKYKSFEYYLKLHLEMWKKEYGP